MDRIGLVTGFEPFAGLPANPSAELLPLLEGVEVGGARIVTRLLPVSVSRAPDIVRGLVMELRPAFVLGLGLASGAAVLRVERLAVNVVSLAVPDNDGVRASGEPVAADAPAAIRATWDAEAIVAALLEAGIPAVGSWHAGTHLCNMTMHCFLRALPAGSGCGFLHLPFTPEQVAVLMRRDDGRRVPPPAAVRELPSMALGIQRDAVRIVLRSLAGRGLATS